METEWVISEYVDNAILVVILFPSKAQETKEFQSLEYVREIFLAPNKCAIHFSKHTG